MIAPVIDLRAHHRPQIEVLEAVVEQIDGAESEGLVADVQVVADSPGNCLGGSGRDAFDSAAGEGGIGVVSNFIP